MLSTFRYIRKKSWGKIGASVGYFSIGLSSATFLGEGYMVSIMERMKIPM